MAPSEKAQACSSFEKRPLVSGEPLLPDVVPKFCSQSPFVQGYSSRPPGQAQTAALPPRPNEQDRRLFASFSGRCTPSAAGCAESCGAREPGLPPATGTRKAFSFRNLCLSCFPDRGLDVGWDSGRRGTWASGTAPKPGKPFFPKADPLTDQIPKVPPASGLGDTPADKVSLHQLHPFATGFMAQASL